MTPEVALETRNQMLRDGYCVVDDILTEEFLQELHDESERLIAGHVEPDEMVYQGQHVNVGGADNPYIQRLLEWQPSRDALEQLGFGDFVASGGIIILTKNPVVHHSIGIKTGCVGMTRSAVPRGPKPFFSITI